MRTRTTQDEAMLISKTSSINDAGLVLAQRVGKVRYHK